MKKGLIPGLTFLAALALAAAPAIAEENRDVRPDGGNGEAAAAAPDPNVVASEETPTHIFLTQEEHDKALARQPLARRTANMTYHGGNIMVTATVKSIFLSLIHISEPTRLG